MSAEDPIDVAAGFLVELAEGAGGTEVLDGPWWMQLGAMVERGWRVTAPPVERDGGRADG